MDPRRFGRRKERSPEKKRTRWALFRERQDSCSRSIKRYKEEINLNTSILAHILLNVVISKNACQIIHAGSKTDYPKKVIHDMSEMELIETEKMMSGGEKTGRKKSVDLYLITPKGILYLAEEAEKNEKTKNGGFDPTFRWLKYIRPEDVQRTLIRGTGWKEKQAIFAKVGEAAYFSEMAGATVPLFSQDPCSPIGEISLQNLEDYHPLRNGRNRPVDPFSERRTNPMKRARKKDLSELVEGAIISWMKAEYGREVDFWSIRAYMCCRNGHVDTSYHPEKKNYIRYVHPTTVKRVSLMSTNSEYLMNTHDSDRGRYSGLLQSRVRTLLLFPSFKPELNWPRQIGTQEQTADYHWKRKLRPEFRTAEKEGVCGMLLIQSPSRLAQLWRNQHSLKAQGVEFGHGYHHLYLEELSPMGAENLNEIMLCSTGQYLENEIERILTPGFSASLHASFERTTGSRSALFPVKTVINGKPTYFAVGTWMDIKQVQEILDYFKNIEPNLDRYGYGVICQHWQDEYYNVMLPGVETYWNGKRCEDECPS